MLCREHFYRNSFQFDKLTLKYLILERVFNRNVHISKLFLSIREWQPAPRQKILNFTYLFFVGDLQTYLLARRHFVSERTFCSDDDEISNRRLTSMALDVARALEYLSKNKYVHRQDSILLQFSLCLYSNIKSYLYSFIHILCLLLSFKSPFRVLRRIHFLLILEVTHSNSSQMGDCSFDEFSALCIVEELFGCPHWSLMLIINF